MRARAPRIAGALALALSLVPLVDCADLSLVPVGVCGNGVVERGEECDGLPECRPSGAEHECRIDCARAACPLGWGCSTEKICRAPSGRFREAFSLPEGAHKVVLADLDGDGRSEIVARGRLGLDGAAKVRVHYASADGAGVEETRSLATGMASLSVRDVDGDGRADLTFREKGISVMKGAAGRSLVPVAFTASRFDDASAVFAPVAGTLPGDSPSGALTIESTDAGVYVVGDDTVVAELPSAYRHVTPLLVAARGRRPLRFVEGPDSACGQIAVGLPSSRVVTVIAPCVASGDTAIWNSAPPRTVELPIKPQRLGAADMNGDGRLDLVAISETKVAVAFSTGADLASASGEVGKASIVGDFTDSGTLGAALAFADLDGDGLVDLVTRRGIFLSRVGEAGARQSVTAVHSLEGAWTEVVTGDFNGDGVDDVVARTEGESDLDFFAGGESMGAATITTSGVVVTMSAVDLDGDGLLDVALAERTAADARVDQVSVAFGRPGASPAAPVVVGQIRDVVQLASLGPVAAYPFDRVDDLAVVSRWKTGARRSGALAIVFGSAARQPLAPMVLPTGDFPFVVAPLRSEAGGRTDLVTVAALAEEAVAFSAWRARGDGAGSYDAPVKLRWSGAGPPPVATARVDQLPQISGAVADIDGDGREELMIAHPVRGGRGRVSMVRVGDSAAETTTLFETAAPSARDGTLFATDADGDGAADVVLVEGSADTVRARGRVTLRFGDGRGAFGEPLVLSDGDDATDVALLAAGPGGGRSFAIVRERGVRIVSVGRDRAVRVAVPDGVGAVAAGTGIAAGDIDGDGVDDLVVVDGGVLRVFLQEPVLR